MRLRLPVIVLFTLGALVTPSWAEVREVDLREDWEHLPYNASHVSRALPGMQTFPSQSLTCLFVDVDGDGQDEMVRSTPRGVAIERLDAERTVLVSRDLPAEFHVLGQPAFGLASCPDITGDGQPEIVAIGRSKDRFSWQLWVLDGVGLKTVSHTLLPRGEDLRPDGRWDGHYQYATHLPASPAGNGGPLLLVACQVTNDMVGRGILSINPGTGQIVWFHPTAAMPQHDTMTAGDFDGDGALEIIAMTDAPAHRTGAVVNTYIDNETRILVLDENGVRQWSTVLSHGLSGTGLAVDDLDGDGRVEVATTTWTSPNPSGWLRIFTLGGELLADQSSELQFKDLALLRESDDSSPDLLVSTSYGTLEVFRYAEQSLDHVLKAALPTDCTINGILDILPDPGPEVFVTDRTGRSLILSATYEPLARFSTTPTAWLGKVRTVCIASGQTEVFQIGNRQGTLALVAAPAPPYTMGTELVVVLVVSGTVIILGWLVTRSRRRRLAPDLQREVRLHLLESLELSHHGDIAPLNSVRRLIFCLRALTTNIGDNERVRVRLGEILTECQEVSLPHLTGIMDRARLAQLDARIVEAGNGAVNRVRLLVNQLAQPRHSAQPDADLVNELYEAEESAHACLRQLRSEVAGIFCADPHQELERVLTANQERMKQAGVQYVVVEKAMMAAGGGRDVVGQSVAVLPEGTRCQIDPVDLVQVLDNLIANATRAMRDAPVRQLSVTQKLVDGMVLIDVTDTGCGMLPADQGRALNSHFTTKHDGGGGMGLPAATKIMRRYSGNIQVLRSEVGRGTTIRVTTIAC